MISECIAIFAIVGQISVLGCGCGQSSIILPSCESNSQPSPVVLVSSSGSGTFLGSSSASGAFTRNVVGNGRYPVALRNCGPISDHQVPVTTSRITAAVQERPTVRLPASIPAPRTICHSCTCFKTIVRPRVNQQIITVPTIQRYIETGHKPVIENIQYEVLPVSCGDSGYSSGSKVQLVEVGNGSSSGRVKLVSFGSDCTCGSQTIQIPQIQSVEVPSVRVVETVQVPQIQTLQIPQSVPFGGCSSQC